jgi:ATP-dependent Lon protease
VAARATERDDPTMDEVLADYRKRIKLAKMPRTVRREARRQLARLSGLDEGSFEHYMVRGYLEAVIEMPWPERVAAERRLLAAVIGQEA